MDDTQSFLETASTRGSTEPVSLSPSASFGERFRPPKGQTEVTTFTFRIYTMMALDGGDSIPFPHSLIVCRLKNGVKRRLT